MRIRVAIADGSICVSRTDARNGIVVVPRVPDGVATVADDIEAVMVVVFARW